LRTVLRTQRPEVSARLDALREKSRVMTPFTFYANLLGAGHGRRQLLGRLGHEAADALDEFLNLALDYERTETPSLQGFIAWLRSAEAEVKRDMEMERDEVRVMTVHGAKGLEAPIVILADTTTPPQGFHPPRLLQLPGSDDRSKLTPPMVWAVAKTQDVGPMAKAREAALDEARDEYRRLLYVGMTRAIERLIVCGVDGINKRPDGCWYDLIRGALEQHCLAEPAGDGVGNVLRYRKILDATAAGTAAREPTGSLVPIPAWLNQTLGPTPEYITPIKPSGFIDDPAKTGLSGARDARRRAIARGNIVHRLMQSLPDLPSTARAEAARRHIERQRTGQATDFTAAEADEIVKQVLAIIEDARFATLFASGSRAEVPIVGRIDGREVAGVVDRLVVTPDAVLIADYKTNRVAPASLAETQARHQGYIQQLSHYRAVLKWLYPDRPIRAALVWTALPTLAEIPAEALDAALAAGTGP
jgi:ATP-dependent helicase/nuclease subunit A